jgi:hypothetical protein
MVDDPESDVVWAGEHEGRWGVRMAQQARDFTTVWFDVGERTLGYEAYVLPAPPHGAAEVYRQCLLRNRGHWRAAFCLDQDGDVYLRGRMPLDQVGAEAVDAALGALYEMIEIAFRPLVRAGFTFREKTS